VAVEQLGIAALVVGALALLGLLIWAEDVVEGERNRHAAFLAQLKEAHPDPPIAHSSAPRQVRRSQPPGSQRRDTWAGEVDLLSL
jgi:hypothetical protein